MSGRHVFSGRSCHLAVLVLTVLVVVAGTGASAPEGEGERVVAIGDIHGAYDDLVTILQETGIIDEKLRWSGGTATFVQLGDVFDRGVRVRDVLDLLMRLQREAPAAGGKVVCLLGNHEAMNMLGILRDANPESLAAFADNDSEERRNSAYKTFKTYWRQRTRHFEQPQPAFTREFKLKWMEAYPPGLLEYRQALNADGVYGAWLRTCPVAYKHDDTLFIHGGISPAMSDLDIDAINSRVVSEIASHDTAKEYMVEERLIVPWATMTEMAHIALKEVETAQEEAHSRHEEHATHAARLEGILGWGDWFLVDADGPLWFRGAAKWDEAEHMTEMEALLDGIAVRHMVVGHTPQLNGHIQTRFDGKVFLVDTGMLSTFYKGGRPAALEIQGGVFTAVYEDGREILFEEPTTRSREHGDAP